MRTDLMQNRMYSSVGSLISSRQEYPNLLHWGIWVPAQRSRSLYYLLVSEASQYPGKRTNVYHHRDGELSQIGIALQILRQNLCICDLDLLLPCHTSDLNSSL